MAKQRSSDLEQSPEFFEHGEHDLVSWSAGYRAAIAGERCKGHPRGSLSVRQRRGWLSWRAGWIAGTAIKSHNVRR